jgi:hypothetical protein
VSFSIKWINLYYRANICPSHSLHNLLPFIKIVRGTIPNNYVIINKNESSLFFTHPHSTKSTIINSSTTNHSSSLLQLLIWARPTFKANLHGHSSRPIILPTQGLSLGPIKASSSPGQITASSTLLHLAQRRPPHTFGPKKASSHIWPKDGLLNSSIFGQLSAVERIMFTPLKVSSPQIPLMYNIIKTN